MQNTRHAEAIKVLQNEIGVIEIGENALAEGIYRESDNPFKIKGELVRRKNALRMSIVALNLDDSDQATIQELTRVLESVLGHGTSNSQAARMSRKYAQDVLANAKKKGAAL